MRRRDFIKVVAGSAAAWPLAVHAQQPGRMRRIGMLGIGDTKNGAYALRDALQRLGWIDGKNVHLEFRFTHLRLDLIKRYAAELVSIRPDVIVCVGSANLVALKKETQTLPIVFILVSDPVGMGHIANFARPGGNLTGFTPFEPSLGGKWVGMLKEVDPRLKRIALLFNPNTAPNAPPFVQTAKAAGKSLRVSVTSMPIRSEPEINRAITDFAQQPGGGVEILPDPYPFSHRKTIIAATLRHHLPLIAPFQPIAKDGALMSYGVSLIDEYRRSASYVDRILRGEKPGDLPVQAPVKYQFAINLKTAKTLGVAVPPSLLMLADQVIE
jgi:putative ABC transport system substrate-binding protein